MKRPTWTPSGAPPFWTSGVLATRSAGGLEELFHFDAKEVARLV
jgi:hypothetical protein